MIQQIRESIIRKMGIEPDHIIPVKKDQFPKTESGKIQRAQLGAALKDGVFHDIERALDLASENEQTLPDWFFKRIWVKRISVHLSRYPLIMYSYLRIKRALSIALCPI
ncbi:hypothetical protein ACTWKB_16045 [Bacillus sp. 4A_MP2]